MLRRYRALIEANPDLILRIDADGRYLDFHSGDQVKLAYPPEALIGRKSTELFSPEFAEAGNRRVQRALETGKMQVWEYPLSINGEMREYEARIVPSGENEVIAIIRDVTENRRAQEQLRLSEARLKEAQRIAKIGSWERNVATNEVWWSEETYCIFGVDPEKPVTLDTLTRRIHPDDRERVSRGVASAQRRGGPYEIHCRVLLPDGTIRSVDGRAKLVADDKGLPEKWVGVVQDVTERVELETEVIAISEREHQRIGADLHDGLGQELTGLSLGLETLSKKLLRENSAQAGAVQELREMAQAMISETRSIARQLSPGLSRELDLGQALNALAEEVQARSKIACLAHCSGDWGHLDPETATHLFRLAQEAVNNAVRHSGAKNIELRYGSEGGSNFLEILDDGVGIPIALDRREGMGIKSMRYRARMVRGSLEIAARPEGGTRVLWSSTTP